MAKYSSYNRRTPLDERPWTIHPIWRGIGCLLMLLIPIMAYAGAILLVQANAEQGWVPMPAELIQTVTLPYFGKVEHLAANLIVAVLLSFVGFALLSFIYSIFYRLINPDPLGPLDAKPVRSRPPAGPRVTRGRRG
jgi:amino acid permease